MAYGFSGMKMKLPRYDKVSIALVDPLGSQSSFVLKFAHDNHSLLQSAYSGRGDRADPTTWPEVEGPLTVGSL